MSGDTLADAVWHDLTALVHENRDGWKRAVIDRSGLPFSRIRILRRVGRGPVTVTRLAEAATVDVPAATVAVNDLEARGLVVRQVDPDNRRCKTVSLTDAGRAVLRDIDDVDDPAPAALAALDADDLQTLRALLAKIAAAQPV
jgi:DNA-binding MarR family transcriptional regulator